jgi:cell wall-associated NlpC family hydrolase
MFSGIDECTALPSVQQEARTRIVEEARSWLCTPFHHEGRVKGIKGGVDCAMLVAEVYERASLVPRIQPEHYPQQWHLHRDQEKFLGWIEKYAYETAAPLPGDVALFHIGRTWSHGGIVVAWPLIIHAWFGTCVEYNDASKEPLAHYEVKFFTLKNWK